VRAGRNDPCPCGSGRKYKKCCLDADLRSEDVAAPPPPPPVEAPAAVPTDPTSPEPESDYWDEFLVRYEDAPVDQQLALLREAVASSEPTAAEVVSDCLVKDADAFRRGGQARELEDLLESIVRDHPDRYGKELGWLAAMRVENAVTCLGSPPREPLLALARLSTREIDRFCDTLDLLCFHGRDEDVVAALEVAWPELRDSPSVMGSTKAELEDLIVALAFERHPEETARLAAGETARIPDLEQLTPVEPELARRVAACRQGLAHRTWTREDFMLSVPRESLSQNLFLLTHLFWAHLRNRVAWPCSRAELARSVVYDSLVRRRAEDPARPPRRKDKLRRRNTVTPRERLLLEIDAREADRFLSSLVLFPSWKAYRAALFALALPHWLGFVSDLGLLAADSWEATLRSLRQRWEALPGILEREVYDPALWEEVRRTWESGSWRA